MKFFTTNLNHLQRAVWLLGTFLLLSFTAIAQQTITGTVTDESQVPLVGVNIVVKGTNTGTTTDDAGRYTLSVPAKATILVLSYIGFAEQEVPIENRTEISVTLSAGDRRLEEVVVVGYGTQQRKDLTGSVASLKSKDVLQVPSVNAIKSMQGLVAGVDIVSNSNAPNASPVIRIRGNRSINAGNDPLIVVDGLPFSGSLNDLNTGDIKSVEVLKDASATAIYGSRGANGVILITTNRGEAGRIRINYNGYYGIQNALNPPDLMTGAEFAEFVRESQRNATPTRYNSPMPSRTLDETMFYFRNADVEASVLAAYDANGNYDPAKVRDYDWIDAVTRQGSQQEHQLSIATGNDKSQLSFSLGYFNNFGIVQGFDYERYNLRLTFDNQVFKKFKIGGTLATSINKNRSTDNLYELGGQVNPLAPFRNAEGRLILEPASDPLTYNPLIRAEGASNKSTSNRFYGNFFAELGLFDGLKYRLSFSPDYRLVRSGSFRNALANQGSPASASYNTNQPFHYVLDNMLMYDKMLNQNHKINITLLQSLEGDRFESSSAAVRDVPYDQQQFYNIGTATEVSSIGSSLSEWTLSSVMARINYGFRSKYLLTLTGRYDGSSRLAPGNKWDFFPSAAVAWNASEEPFIQSLNLFSDLKIRASYGITGNTAIAPYQTQGGLTRTIYATDDIPAYGYQPNLIVNPDLGWEKTGQANIGMDFGIWNNRISATVDVYQQNTTDLLLARQLPTASGFVSIVENVGATRNTGIEAALRLAVFAGENRKFRWVNQLTFTRNKEEIVELYNGEVDDIGNSWFIGSPVTTYFDYKKIGIFQNTDADKELIATYNKNGGTFAPGEIKVQDTNGDGRINADDRVILGSAVPEWYGSLNTTFELAGFDLNFLIFARQGQTVNDDQGILYEGRNNWLNVDYWTPNNPTNAFPRPVTGRRVPLFASTLAYQDGSFIRLRNVTLGYRLPERLLERLRASNLRIYVSALNPLLLTDFIGIDPEGSTGITTPSVTTYLAGINVTF
jgi:TonB-linked SusC/RagA family outer membrane protein